MSASLASIGWAGCPQSLSPLLPQPRFLTILKAMATQSSPAATAAAKRVIICGGGVIGVCTAYFLAQKGAAVTIIEKSSIACAASGKAGGFLALDWCDGGPLGDLARASFRLHRSLSDLLDGPRSYGYRPLTTLSLAISAGAAGSDIPVGAVPSWVDGGAAGTPRTIGTPATTAQVHPQLFTRALLAAASGGVEVVIGEVESVEVMGGRAVGVVIKGGGGKLIEGDAVVLALGPWSNRSPLVSSLFAVSGMKAHSIVLLPQDAASITPHALSLSYQPSSGAELLDLEVYPRPTGEVYICGMLKEAEVPDEPEAIVGDHESIRMLHNIAEMVSSHLKDGEAEVVAEQACFLPCTEDSLPVIGEIPGVEGCFVATGHSCWGILNGPATGASLAELILDGQATIVDLKPFSPSRFAGRRIGRRK